MNEHHIGAGSPRGDRSKAVVGALAAALLGLSVLGGCAGGSEPGTQVSTAPSPGQSDQAGAVTVRDAWAKIADKGRSAVFGTLVNSGGRELTVVSATSSASPVVELHEVATVDGKMVMQPKAGGFVIPANGTHELAPGGDHLMLMNVTTPVRAGDAVKVTLTLSDGSTVEFVAVGKAFAGGNESYAPMNMG